MHARPWSASSAKTQPRFAKLSGWRGPLYLRGFAAPLPMVLFRSDFHRARPLYPESRHLQHSPGDRPGRHTDARYVQKLKEKIERPRAPYPQFFLGSVVITSEIVKSNYVAVHPEP